MKELKPSENLINFIRAYESLHDGDLTALGLQPKLDACDIWTEGYGEVMYIEGVRATIRNYPTLASVIPHRTIKTEAEANIKLIDSLNSRALKVNEHITRELKQNEFDALLSHYYNCGYSETLFKLVNKQADSKKIKDWFTKHYITGGGVVLKGLQLRRQDEAQMYFLGDYTRDYKFSPFDF